MVRRKNDFNHRSGSPTAIPSLGSAVCFLPPFLCENIAVPRWRNAEERNEGDLIGVGFGLNFNLIKGHLGFELALKRLDGQKKLR